MSEKCNLSEKQLIFCKEYMTDFNATRSAIRAGYSEKSAHVQANRMLKNDKVKTYIAKHKAERIEKLDITAENVLKEIANVAFFDIRNIFDGNYLKQVSDLDDKTARAVSSVKSRIEKTDGENFAEVIEVKSNDKLKALDMLSKHLGLYENDNKQKETSKTIEAKEPDF